jgi:hypothetical protein
MMEESTFVEGVPDRVVKKYANEYLKLAVRLVNLFPPHVDVAEKFTAEMGTSEYVRHRHVLQKRFDDAVVREDVGGAGSAAMQIASLRNPLNYMKDDFVELGVASPELEWNVPVFISSKGTHVSQGGGVNYSQNRTRDYLSLGENAEYAYLGGRN